MKTCITARQFLPPPFLLLLISNLILRLPNTYIKAIAIDPSNPSHLFIASDYGVYKSINDGASWTAYSSGLLPAIEGVQLIIYDTQRKLRLVSHGNGLWERSI